MYKNKDKNMAYISIIAIVAIVGMFIMFFSTATTKVSTTEQEDLTGQAFAGFKDTKSIGGEKLGLWPPEDCDFFWNGGSYEIYECDGGIYYECSGGDCREI